MIDFQDIEMFLYQDIKTSVLKEFWTDWDEEAEGLCDQVFAEVMRWDQ